ncbi:diadenylate cyclase [Robiginitomaculum antarcticum]|uniref:diadenylate cyclase n=1 Tax=Robiginitomaculum antarcticum TaxID=437507 RepID=UPI000365F54F|nr:diadenylate cyclase [Robiginitomaculum antarcticum]
MIDLGAEQERHITFLEREFDENGFLQDDPHNLKQSLLREVVETIFEPAFEGQKPIHGAIICSHPFNKYKQDLPFDIKINDDTNLAQTYCDGVTVFRLRGNGDRGVVVLTEPIINELDLFTLRDDVLYKLSGNSHTETPSKELYAVKKGKSGEITILCREGIVVHRDARLEFFRYQYHFKSKLMDFIEAKWTDNPWEKQTLDSILRMAIHILSPIPGVGGTFVLLHPDDPIDYCETSHIIEETELLNLKNSMSFPWGLDVTQRAHQTILGNLMKNTDGAVVLSSDGVVKAAKSWLVIPRDKISVNESDGGTRHLTSQSFSSMIQGLVFVVSSDGPVTLYCGEQKVFRTNEDG